MRARIVPIVLVVLALVTAACGDGDDKKVLTEARLQGYLLTQEDVPDGFTLQEAEEEEEEEEEGGTGCLDADTDDMVPPAATATAEFATADDSQHISHEVESYEEGDATQAMAEGRKLFEKCKTFEENLEGTPVKGTITEADAPDLGDEAVAFDLSAELQGILIEGSFVAVRQGDVITAVSMFNTGAPVDPATVRQMIVRAVQRAADVEATQQ